MANTSYTSVPQSDHNENIEHRNENIGNQQENVTIDVNNGRRNEQDAGPEGEQNNTQHDRWVLQRLALYRAT